MLVWQCHLSSKGLPLPTLRAAWGNKHRHVGSSWHRLEYFHWKLPLGLVRGMRSTDRGPMYPECRGRYPLLDVLCPLDKSISLHKTGPFLFSYVWTIPTRDIPTWQLPTRKIPTSMDGWLRLIREIPTR